MEEEIWKPVVGYENLYAVSNLGRVKSLFRYKKILKPIVGVQGYLYINLYKEKRHSLKRVHQLVAQAFIPNPNNYPFVNHKDENVINNNVNNLEWCTAKYNCNYGTRIKRIAKKNNKPILQFDLDNNFIKEYESITQASKELNNSLDNISSCCLGRRTTRGYIFRFKNDKEILQKYKETIGNKDENNTQI